VEATTTSDPGSAGWYPDPSGRYEFRYFNGQRWTSDVAVDGQRYVDQTPLADPVAPGPAAPPSGPAAIAVVPHPPGVSAAAPGNAMAILSFLFGLGAVALGWTPFLFVIGAGLGVAALVLGIVVLRRRPTVRKTRGFAIAGVTLAPIGLALCAVGIILTGVTLREFDDYSNPGPLDVEVTSCTLDAGMATMAGTIENEDDRVRSYVIRIEFLDGIRGVERDGVAVDEVSPGATTEWSTQQFVGDVDLDCRVRGVNGPYPFDLETQR
jgi:Protein of unknown function (DUF2510)